MSEAPATTARAQDVAALEAAAARLEQLAVRIGAPGATPEELRSLADEVLALGADITERLPRALRVPDEHRGDHGQG